MHAVDEGVMPNTFLILLSKAMGSNSVIKLISLESEGNLCVLCCILSVPQRQAAICFKDMVLLYLAVLH